MKQAIINNLARVLVGLVVSAISGIALLALQPVKDIISVPAQIEKIQQDQVLFQQSVLMQQADFITALDRQAMVDSAFVKKFRLVQEANSTIAKNQGIIRSKMNAICDEFPMLHNRFNTIEEAVKNQQAIQAFNNKIHTYSYEASR